jgi:hypothetical protein
LAWGGLHQWRLLCCWLSAAPVRQHPAVLGAVTPLTCGNVWGCVARTGMLGGSVSCYTQWHPVANPWAGLKHLQGFLLLTSRHCLATAGVTWPSANRMGLSAVVFARACALGCLHGQALPVMAPSVLWQWGASQQRLEQAPDCAQHSRWGAAAWAAYACYAATAYMALCPGCWHGTSS